MTEPLALRVCKRGSRKARVTVTRLRPVVIAGASTNAPWQGGIRGPEVDRHGKVVGESDGDYDTLTVNNESRFMGKESLNYELDLTEKKFFGEQK